MTAWIVTGLLVVARLTPVALLLPSAFAATAPRRWGIGLVVVCTLAIVPRYASIGVLTEVSGSALALSLLRELILGLMLSLGCLLLLAGLSLAGTVLSQLSGIGLTGLADPGGQLMGGESVVQRYFGWLSLAVLLVSGGHRLLFAALLDSFSRIPPGGPLPDLAAAQLGQLLAIAFHAGLRVAAPVAFCLIISALTIAVIGQTMPALGALGLGVSVNLLVLLLVTFLSIESIATAYQQAWCTGLERMLAEWLEPLG